MKVLEITFNPPNKKSGGGLGIYQSIRSLLDNAEVDYIGPDFDRSIFSDKLNVIHILEMDNNMFRRFFYMLIYGITTSFYHSWHGFIKNIDWPSYDYIHVEFSRYRFIIDSAHKNNKYCIVREHNIETDYGKESWNSQKSFTNMIRYFSFWKNEKEVLSKADSVVFITREDEARALQLFGKNKYRSFINPICIEQNQLKNRSRDNSEILILLTGSLNFGPNSEGVVWFIKNVWGKVCQDENLEKAKLLIAGYKPNEKLKELIRKTKRAEIIDTPKEMQPYFLDADLYVAPVFNGAGMKVKVAEALSYGLPVIGTPHALIGYDCIKENIYCAHDAQEFCKLLIKLGGDSIDFTTKQRIRQEFHACLSMESSINRYREILRGEK